MQKIFAVILTYNRKDLLKRCMEAVYSQTRQCDGVIVIDNASTDGTEQQLLESAYPNLKVYVLSSNIGASGGFNAGFRLAYQNGADFIWVMDDDVIPNPDTLSCLLKADEKLQRKNINRAYLLSSAYTESGLVTNTPGLSLQENEIGYLSWPEMIEHGMVPVWRATFVSILLPRSTLTKYGLPIASMFIWGEDSEYTLRVTRDNPGFLIGESKVLHLRQENGPINILSENNPGRMKYHKYFMRNKIFITRKYSLHYRQLISEIYGVLRLLFKLLRKKHFHKAKVVLQGMIESVFFFPEEESADAPISSLKIKIHSFETDSTVSDTVVGLNYSPSKNSALHSNGLH
ncbi:glycosyltransferase family 2 protein [Halomonas sp. GXIMD04776]|uniref:glycosyltransferase family 2 protein n=1 Tax=Halomonas sp. GXIMD04776 TaxID=3415605 RepID=UPI003CC1C602